MKSPSDSEMDLDKTPTNISASKVNMNLLDDDDWVKMKEFILKSGNNEIIRCLKNSEIKVAALTKCIEELKGEAQWSRKHIIRLDKAMKKLEAMVCNEKTQRLKAECRALQSTVLIRGISIHPDAANLNRPETQTESRTQVAETLKGIGMDLVENGLSDTYRLPQKSIVTRAGATIVTDAIRVTFQTHRGKLALYTAMVAKGKDFPLIKIADAIPFDLVKEKKKLDDLAADYRVLKPGIRTRTVCRFGEVFIMVKAEGTTKYVRKETCEIAAELKKATGQTTEGEDEYDDDIESDLHTVVKKKRNKRSRRSSFF